MQQHGSKYFAPGPHPLTLGVGSNVKIQTIATHSHIAYQIKGNQECSNIVGNIWPADCNHYRQGQKVKIQILLNMVMLHIKLKGITNAATLL